ncbi:hypothetical protein FQZ97_799070 [compost metagenome]
MLAPEWLQAFEPERGDIAIDRQVRQPCLFSGSAEEPALMKARVGYRDGGFLATPGIEGVGQADATCSGQGRNSGPGEAGLEEVTSVHGEFRSNPSGTRLMPPLPGGVSDSEG